MVGKGRDDYRQGNISSGLYIRCKELQFTSSWSGIEESQVSIQKQLTLDGKG